MGEQTKFIYLNMVGNLAWPNRAARGVVIDVCQYLIESPDDVELGQQQEKDFIRISYQYQARKRMARPRKYGFRRAK